MKPLLISTGLLLCTLLSGCITTSRSSLFHGDGALIHRSQATDTWDARYKGVSVGIARQYRQESGGSMVMVQNLWGQDLGLVDSLGRAWRYRPHQEPLWLGSGTVREGVEWILDRKPLQLVPSGQ